MVIFDKTVISAQSAAGTTGYVPLPSKAENIVVYIESSAGVSSGAVTIEEAAYADYPGTWDAIGSAINAPSASTVVATHIAIGAYGAIRVRISTVIGGGTVTVRVIGTD